MGDRIRDDWTLKATHAEEDMVRARNVVKAVTGRVMLIPV